MTCAPITTPRFSHSLIRSIKPDECILAGTLSDADYL
jgi:hypothetical protein